MTPKAIVDRMFSKDAFSQWLGIEVLAAKEGSSELRMTVRPEMLNGFGIAHGGITYSLADSALAFASNSFGVQSVSIETSIAHTRSVSAGDVLTAKSTLENMSKRTAIFIIRINNQNNEQVALFKGTVYRTEKMWAE